MAKQYLFLIWLFLCVLNVCAQNLVCADFKTGTFYIPTVEESTIFTFTEKDSLNSKSSDFTIKNDPKVKRYVVVRNINTQTEWANGLNVGEPMYETIEWIDDCKFRLFFDETKMDLDDEQEWLNEHNGLLVTILNIEGKCMRYKASVQVSSTDEISQEAIMCKE